MTDLHGTSEPRVSTPREPRCSETARGTSERKLRAGPDPTVRGGCCGADGGDSTRAGRVSLGSPPTAASASRVGRWRGWRPRLTRGAAPRMTPTTESAVPTCLPRSARRSCNWRQNARSPRSWRSSCSSTPGGAPPAGCRSRRLLPAPAHSSPRALNCCSIRSASPTRCWFAYRSRACSQAWRASARPPATAWAWPSRSRTFGSS